MIWTLTRPGRRSVFYGNGLGWAAWLAAAGGLAGRRRPYRTPGNFISTALEVYLIELGAIGPPGREAEMNKGIGYAVAAYGLWGLLPIYWKWLHTVPAVEVIGHRILWSFLTLAIAIAAMRQGRGFLSAVRQPGVLRVYLAAAALIGVNWLVYVWAVNSGFIVETSLGYFINPLVSVVLGVAFLGERLRLGQWVPVGLAAAGVVYLTAVYGSLPWIALTLAGSFGTYGLVKKTAPLNSVYGLALETGLLAPLALVYLAWVESAPPGAFLHPGPATALLLAGAGVVTTVPLLLFASAAQRIPLSMVGILQYIAPTIQFLLGVFVYGEPFSAHQFVGFGLVWAGLIFFSVEGLLTYRARAAAAPAVGE